MAWVPKCVPTHSEGTKIAAREKREWAADHLHRELWLELPERFEWEQILKTIRPTGQTR